MYADAVVIGLLDGLTPLLPWLVALAASWVVVACPMPGRGPGLFSRRDPWRGFKFEARRIVMARAGGRCEGAIFLAWGRCRQSATEADHIHPWCKGGATIVSNGEALCRDHNRRKSSMTPPWWYVLSLEHRRRRYFPVGEDVRMDAAMTRADRQARVASRPPSAAPQPPS